MNEDLRGAAVIVTRPAGQADALCAAVERQGGKALRLPLLQIDALIDAQSPETAVQRFAGYDWVVFISANAVNFALQANSGTISRLHGVRFAAVGNATAEAMRALQVPVDLLPVQGFNSEALLAMPEFRHLQGRCCLIVRGEGGRELLADTLRQRGARVDYWEVYKRAKPAVDLAQFDRVLATQRPAVLVVTSGEALQNFIELCGAAVPQRWLATPLAVISHRIARMAQEMGFQRIAVASEPSDAAIIKTVSALIDGE